jgi:ABC-type uncharacterized transport system auxiliary subunit
MRLAATPRLVAIVTAVALTASTAGCVTPARNEPQYEAKARAAVQAATGEVATGMLVVLQDRQGKVFRSYADEVVTGSENAVGSVSQTFGSVQPPDRASDEIRDAVTQVLSSAQDALAHARIAVRRSDLPALDSSLNELLSAKTALDSAQAKLR